MPLLFKDQKQKEIKNGFLELSYNLPTGLQLNLLIV